MHQIRSSRLAACRQITSAVIILLVAYAASAERLTSKDIVHVTSTMQGRMPLAQSSKCWRQGIRSLILVPANQGNIKPSESRSNDRYLEGEDVPGFQMAGDYRMASSPLAAHKTFQGSYKWMIVGDDDTVFFMQPLLGMLEAFDHRLPYIITDQYWNARELNGGMSFNAVRPSQLAPRCLPCHLGSQTDLDRSNSVLYNRFGCPCTPSLACARVKKQKLPSDIVPHHRTECIEQRGIRWHLYGGAGFVLSAGLLEQLAPREEEFRACLLTQRGDFGDKAMSWCLFGMGFGMTDPGPYALGTVQQPLFDSFGTGNNGITGAQLREKLEKLLPRNKEHNELSRAEEQALRSMVSWHTKARSNFETSEEGAVDICHTMAVYYEATACASSHG